MTTETQSDLMKLLSLVRETRTNEKSHTHVLLGAPFGKINVGSRLSEFWTLYMKCANMKNPIYLAETPGSELPVLVDIDLKTRVSKNTDLKQHIYTEDQVITVVKAYQTALASVMQKITPDALTCVLLEKDPYITETNGIKYIKNGFHLHFPKLFTDTKVQEAYIIPIVKKNLKGLFDNLQKDVEFIDSGSIKVHWLMYGSKKPDHFPYVATKCFSCDAKEISFEEALGDYILPKFRDEDKQISCAGNVKKYLPRILSTFLYGRESVYYYKSKPSVNTPIVEECAKIKEKRSEFVKKSIDDSMEEVRSLMGLLSDKRADDRSDWLAIGFCLWNITQGDDDGLSEWLEFSDRSDKFCEAECICMWNGMHENQYTIGTLKYFAKHDSPKEFEELSKSKGKLLLYHAIDGGHNDLAKILFNEYGNEFVFSTNNCTWYKFCNHVWKMTDKCFDLRERISDPNGAIIGQFQQFISGLLQEKRDSPKQAGDYDAKIKSIKKLIKCCKSTTFKNAVMIECAEVFRNETFCRRLNKDPYLIAFKNGVYDFANDTFRDGKPEDYLSESLPIDYKDFGSVDHSDVIEIAEFFRKIFPDNDIREYFLDQACQVFVGGNHDKVILFWTGSGNNGKTVTQTLFEKMLGRLAIKFSTSLLTGKKQQMGQAAPELARAGDGVRWAVMDEPNQDETIISAGTMKGMTGNDSYLARDLFQKGKDTHEITPFFKIHMICNKLPGIKDADEATWNRIRVVPFESKFAPESDCPQTYEEQVEKKMFPMDKNFNDRMPYMLEPLAWFLIQRWKTFNKLERIVPEKVKIATNMYKQDNDIYKQFSDQFIDDDKEDGKLQVDFLYNRFKEWFRESFPGQQIPVKSVTIARFSALWNSVPSGLKRVWNGLSFKHNDEDDEDDDEVSLAPVHRLKNTLHPMAKRCV